MHTEPVEKIVDRYINDWGYKPEEMEREIMNNWEMEETEKWRAIIWVKAEYKK